MCKTQTIYWFYMTLLMYFLQKKFWLGYYSLISTTRDGREQHLIYLTRSMNLTYLQERNQSKAYLRWNLIKEDILLEHGRFTTQTTRLGSIPARTTYIDHLPQPFSFYCPTSSNIELHSTNILLSDSKNRQRETENRQIVASKN